MMALRLRKVAEGLRTRFTKAATLLEDAAEDVLPSHLQTLLKSVVARNAMNVSLTPELERFVGEKVESGLYNNASEVVREGLRLLKEHDEVRLRWREQIERGWQEVQAGRVVDGPSAMAGIKQRVKAGSKKRA